LSWYDSPYWEGSVVEVKMYGGGYVIGVKKGACIQFFHTVEKFNVGDKVKIYVSLDGKNVRFERVD